MTQTYDANDLGVEALVGRTVLSALINPEKDAVLLKTDEGDYFLRWAGFCCAHCFIAHVNGTDLLIGSTILSAENTEWSDVTRTDDGGLREVVETMGTKLKTTKGYVDIETRVSHNGYYSGEVHVSKAGYIDAYDCFVEVKGVDLPLEDF